jgi:hypothetical protein
MDARGDCMTFIRNTFLAAILLAGLAGAAHALALKNIAGKWCGEATDYTFSSDTLVVDFSDGSPSRKFKVTSYEYIGDTVKMHWINKGEETYTDFSEFSEFSADGRRMAQQKNEAGPRRLFQRC